MKRALLSISFMLLLGTGIAAAASDQKPLIDQFALTSPAFRNGGDIPELYTCKGSDTNPPLVIHNTPRGTVSLAITVREPDNPIAPWTLWLVYNIRPGIREVRAGSVPGTQALNDFGNFYYGGPCTFDAKKHHFVFTVYALDAYLDDVNEGATLDVLEKAMKGKILDRARLIGVYQNPLWGQDEEPL